MTAKITPPAAKIGKWRKMRDDNMTTEELEDMARWLLREIDKRPQLSDALSDRCGTLLNVFSAVRTIHNAEGAIPQEVRQYRYNKMGELLRLAMEISSDLSWTLNGCL